MDRPSVQRVLAVRRRVLATSGLVVSRGVTGRLTRLVGARRAIPTATPRLGGSHVTLGVAADDPVPGTVALWTRVEPA